MKIGIFGGSFNPIHNGHISVMNRVIEKNLVDEIWVMPCKKHPLDKFLDKEEYRVAMVKLALIDLENIKFCDFELRKDGKSYTYDTLRKLKQKYLHDFSWIIGSDILKQISTWHGYEHLQKEAKFIVLHRAGYSIFNPGINIESTLDIPTEDISSTKIRARVRQGKSISNMVPGAVEEYIQQNQLYQK